MGGLLVGGALLPLALEQRGLGSEDLLVDPAQEGIVELDELLPRDVGKHRTALPFVHQVPHRRNCLLAATLVGNLGIVGNEVKLAATMTQAPLLDFMAAHKKARLVT